MSATATRDHSRPTSAPALRPLENGNRLARAEFHRRHEGMPRVKQAELIEGIVHMPSPVRINAHSKPHSDLMFWLTSHAMATPGREVGDNGTLPLDADNELQPDAFPRVHEKCGGRSFVNEDDYLEGAPELLAEVPASSASYDLRERKDGYRRNGVREHLVWQVLNRPLDGWELVEGEYRPLVGNAAGVVESRVFPGLRLACEPLLAGELGAVLARLPRGLAGGVHREAT